MYLLNADRGNRQSVGFGNELNGGPGESDAGCGELKLVLNMSIQHCPACFLREILIKQETPLHIGIAVPQGQQYDGNSYVSQSLLGETRKRLCPDYAETPGEPTELLVLSRNDQGISRCRETAWSRFRRRSYHARQ